MIWKSIDEKSWIARRNIEKLQASMSEQKSDCSGREMNVCDWEKEWKQLMI